MSLSQKTLWTNQFEALQALEPTSLKILRLEGQAFHHSHNQMSSNFLKATFKKRWSGGPLWAFRLVNVLRKIFWIHASNVDAWHRVEQLCFRGRFGRRSSHMIPSLDSRYSPGSVPDFVHFRVPGVFNIWGKDISTTIHHYSKTSNMLFIGYIFVCVQNIWGFPSSKPRKRILFRSMSIYI